jgi:hypothetical protein
MPLPRRTYPTTFDDVSFAFETPMNYFADDPHPMPASFASMDTWATLLRMECAVAASWIAVHGRPATEGSVQHWLRVFAASQAVTISTMAVGAVGGLLCHHPAMLATARQSCNGEAFDLSIAAFEDAGHMLIAVAACEARITADYLPTLKDCIRTIELDLPRGPTLPLAPQQDAPLLATIEHDPSLPLPRDANEVWQRDKEKKRNAAVDDALPLIAAGKYDEAELAVRRADDSIQVAVAIARMYTDALADMVKDGRHKRDRPTAEALFGRALRWKQSAYPEPHTAYEADDYERGRATDRAELVAILGYDPTAN